MCVGEETEGKVHNALIKIIRCWRSKKEPLRAEKKSDFQPCYEEMDFVEFSVLTYPKTPSLLVQYSSFLRIVLEKHGENSRRQPI